jgi:vitamin B12 transporter
MLWCRSFAVLCAVPAMLSLFVLVYSVSAQDIVVADESETIETPDVIVSATKTEVPLKNVASAVEVITGEEMERKRMKTVIEALRQAQGLFAFSQGGPGTLANVRIRGAETKHTLVIIDGVIANSPTNGAYNFADLTTDNIERIEILRGAQGMLYGADAIGGVISITTKKGTGAPTASAFFEYGSFATFREGASLSGAQGPIDFSFLMSKWDTSGFSAVNYRRGATERDGYHNWQGSGKLGLALPHDGRLEFSLRWIDAINNFDSAFGNSAFDVLGASGTNRALMLSGTYVQPITSWWQQKLTLAQNNERQRSLSGTFFRDVATGSSFSSDQFRSDLEILNRRVEWQHNVRIGEPLLLTAGYQFREEQGDSIGFFGAAQPNRLISSHAGFAQAQLNLVDRLIVTGGVRQDSFNVFGDATTYKTTAAFLIPETNTKLRATYGTGFRTPTLNDLYFVNSDNPNLRPEKSRSFDAGIDQTLWKGRLVMSATYFWNRFQDLIAFQFSDPVCPPSAIFGCAVNINEARTQGWELGLNAKLLSNLEVRAQYTMTMSRDLTTNLRLSRRPLDMASAGITYRPIEQVRVNADYRFVGARNNDVANTPSQKQGSYGVVDLSGSYDLTKNWQVFGRAENLFNQFYEEVLFFGAPIRSVFGGVKFTY